MAGLLGIDHPLIAVRDIAAMRERYAALGFVMTPITQHPWGTATTVAAFAGCLLELIGIGDERLIDAMPAGEFRFGRTIRDQLTEREGIALVALHSDNADADAAGVQARGIVCQGGIEFGRDIVRPDGQPDRTATSLRILFDPALPRVSHFLCQQHRRDLIEAPQWRAHPNGATGIGQVSLVASPADQAAVRRRFAGLYGPAAIIPAPDGFTVQTGRGVFAVGERAWAERSYGPPPVADARPHCAAVHLRVPDLAPLLAVLERSGAAHHRQGQRVVLQDAASFGNVFLTFDAAASPGSR